MFFSLTIIKFPLSIYKVKNIAGDPSLLCFLYKQVIAFSLKIYLCILL